jgi:hypothetical protein
VFDFGPDIGDVFLTGGPSIGPGDTTIIWKLQSDTFLSGPGSSAKIPFENIGLSSVSRVPVNIGGRLFDVFIELDPSRPSIGQLDITQDLVDDGTKTPVGTFTYSLITYFIAIFTPQDGETGIFQVINSVDLSSIDGGKWSYNPGPNFVVTPESSNFFVTGCFFAGTKTRGGHTASATVTGTGKTCPPVPEPNPTLGILALGTLGAGLTFKRKLKSSKSTEKEARFKSGRC